MKKYLLLLVLATLLTMPAAVFAADYITSSNVVIPEDTYNNLRGLFTEKRISLMTQEEYDNFMDLGPNFDTLVSNKIYVKSVYNNITGEVNNYEITKSEYDNVLLSTVQDRSLVHETNYKTLGLGLVELSDGTAYFCDSLVWKIMPSVRSYDVNAVRTVNLSVLYGSQEGNQIYTYLGNNYVINYSYDGTNINNFSNGFGISMNLVDLDTTYLESDLDAIFYITNYAAQAFASYQHAVRNISLSTSKSYTLSASGLGGAILFDPTSYANYYDKMGGVFSYISA